MSSTPGNGENYRDLLKSAFLQIKQLRSQLAESEARQPEPIAVIGMGCRFPGPAVNPDAYWQLLHDGVDAVSTVSADRWRHDAYFDADADAPGKMYTLQGGFLREIDRFEPEFFGISPREALSLDPQHRLLLEVCWEAIEHAGYAPQALKGSRTGVYVGLDTDDYSKFSMNSRDAALINGHTKLGNARSFAAGRVAYVFGFHGPTMQMDTTCSSSGLAVHLACQSLRLGEADLALAGGVNLILAPHHTISFCNLKALSPSGHCHTFDQKADGYVRGEGCGMVFLKRLSDAQADGDQILAVIRGSAVNHDGRSNGMTAPNGLAQEALIRQALKSADLDAEQIQYVEAHGTGTSLGDPIEVNALSRALERHQADAPPLFVGSVKTNIGHLETAAAVAGLIKIILALKHQTIPPHLHFETPNPYIPWDKLAVQIPTRPQTWSAPASGEPRRAGLSAFGMSGTNVHLIVEEPPVQTSQKPQSARPAELITLSARSETALNDLVDHYIDSLAEGKRESLSDISYTGQVGRNHFRQRLAVVAESREALSEKLAAYRAGKGGVSEGEAQGTPRVAFLFTGQGSQYPGMGRELYESSAVAREALERCATLLRPHLPVDLLEILLNEDERIHQTQYTQVGLFALEYALAEVWQSWGIRPAVVLGHSIGEIAAACVAGMMSLEEGLALVAARGRLMQAQPQTGSMAVIFASESEVRPEVMLRPGVSVAALNGPRNIVISGEQSGVAEIVGHFAAQGVRAQELVVSHAFHSPEMAGMVGPFGEVAKQLSYRKPQVKVISNVSGELGGEEMLRGGYWESHVREAVRFASGMETLVEMGIDIFVEIGPRPVLLGMGRQCVPEVGGSWLPSMRKGRGVWETLLESVGELYVRGVEIDWEGLHGESGGRKVSLPTYPFQRERYWQGISIPGKQIWSEEKTHPMLGRRLSLPRSSEVRFENRFSPDHPAYLRDHRIFGAVVVPAASHISMVLSGVKEAWGEEGCRIDEILFPQPLVLEEEGEAAVQLLLQPEQNGEYGVEIVSQGGEQWRTHASCRVAVEGRRGERSDKIDLAAVQARCSVNSDGFSFYDRFSTTGYGWGPSFRWLSELWSGEGEALCRMEAAETSLLGDVSRYQLHPGLIDSAFHVLASCEPELAAELVSGDYLYIPFHIDRIRLLRAAEAGRPLWVHAQTHPSESAMGPKRMKGDIRIYDEDGLLIGEIVGFEGRRASRAAVERSVQQVEAEEWFYESSWQVSEWTPAADEVGERRWLVIGSDVIAAQLRALGDGAEETSVEQLSEKLRSEDRFDGLVFAAHDLKVTADSLAHEMPALQEQLCGSLLKIVGELSQSAQEPAPRLAVVTMEGRHVRGDEGISTVVQAPLWGMSRVAGLEHPEWGVMSIDLAQDEESAWGAQVRSALSEAMVREGEVAYRSGERYLPRLQPANPAGAWVSIRSDGSYLISGGLGALGLRVAEWLAEQGAEHLLLLGRRGPDEAAAAKVSELRQRGVAVQIVQVDVCDRSALREVIAGAEPPIRGMIHAAGVLDDGLLMQQSWERVWEVMKPKVVGGWHLHELSQELELDFLVLFSSVASLLGSRSQGGYAAGNSFLDALSRWRAGEGQPSLSINWGPWGSIGMAAELGEGERQRLSRQGIELLEPEAALTSLGRLLGSGCRQVGVLDVNWASYVQQWPAERRPGYYDELVEEGEASGQTAWLMAELLAKEADERAAHLGYALRAALAQTLGLATAEQIGSRERFFDLGLDSLMAIELKQQLEQGLGRTLRATLMFDYPMVEALTDYLLSHLDLGSDQTSKTAAAPQNEDQDTRDIEVDELLDELNDLSDEDILQQLFQQKG
ncbi:MAG: type I polyketide synthase [Ardenticatenaceae bacterium]|nr:type I polyketide synthase [Ardenticatenaceae bacterium]